MGALARVLMCQVYVLNSTRLAVHETFVCATVCWKALFFKLCLWVISIHCWSPWAVVGPRHRLPPYDHKTPSQHYVRLWYYCWYPTLAIVGATDRKLKRSLLVCLSSCFFCCLILSSLSASWCRMSKRPGSARGSQSFARSSLCLPVWLDSVIINDDWCIDVIENNKLDH